MNSKTARNLVWAGHLMSVIPAVIWPALFIASGMSLAAGSGGFTQCVHSVWGAFLCTSMIYPLLFIVGIIATYILSKRQKYHLAIAASWSAFGMLLILFLWSGGGGALFQK
jgi:hypothetical protein